MRRLSPHSSAAGYSPNRLVPLSPAPVLDQGQRLTDIQAIHRLFANGERGGYWPADPALLYEYSAGTIPASVNGVVGLLLDQSRGLRLGDELTVNGGFDSDTAWTKSAGVSISDGVIHYNSVTVGSSASQALPSGTGSGNTYLIEFTILNYVSGSFGINVGNGVRPLASSNGKFRFIAEGGTGNLVELGARATPTTLDVDNVSVKRIHGSHASQATTANKPYLRRTPVSGKYWLDSNTSTGALTATFASSLGSTCTIATVGAEGVTIAENQTVGTSYNIAPAYGYNGDVLIINRALTASEKALVTRVLRRGVPLLGRELVTNGNFENGTTGWTANDANISVVDGKLRIETIVDYGRATTPVQLNTGESYRVFAQVTTVSGNAANTVAISPSSTGGGTVRIQNSGSGSRSITLLYFSTVSEINYVTLQNNTPAASTHDFDNVSAKAIL